MYRFAHVPSPCLTACRAARLALTTAFLCVAGAPRSYAQATDRLAGVYFGTELRSQLNFRTNSYEYRTITHVLLFDGHGRVVRGIPAGGLARFDWDSALAASPEAGGRYRDNGGSVEIAWANGTGTTLASVDRTGVLRLGRANLTRVVSPPGMRIDGTYATESFANVSVPGGAQGGVSSWRRIAFARDGHFDTGSATGVDVTGSDGAGYARDRAAGRGTYRIDDFTLVLEFESGVRQAFPFWVDVAASATPSPEWIAVGGRVWLRR